MTLPGIRGLAAKLLPIVLGIACAACGGAAAPASQPASPSTASAQAPAPSVSAAASPAASAAAKPAAASAPAGSAAAAPASAKPAASPSVPATTVKVGNIGSPSDAGVYIGLDHGYFAAQGINVDLTHFTSGAQIAPALGAEQVQVGGGAVSPAFFNLPLHKIPVKIVADKGKLLPGFGYEGLLVRQDLLDSGAVKSAADLKGRKIAFNGTHFLVDIALTKAGVASSGVDWVELAFPDMVVALGNKAIDGAMYLEPFGQAAEAKHVATRWLTGDKIDPGHQMGVLFFSPKFFDNKALAQGFMTAYIQGVRDYDAAFRQGKNKADVINILTKYGSAKDPAMYDSMVPPGLDPNGSVNVPSLQADFDWYIANGQLKDKMDVSEMVDTSLLNATLQKLGKAS